MEREWREKLRWNAMAQSEGVREAERGQRRAVEHGDGELAHILAQELFWHCQRNL